MLTYKDIRSNNEINTYMEKGNSVLGVMGFTDHGPAHARIAALKASSILKTLNYPERTVELSKIAGYMHDIGNCVNRHDHAQSGALMALQILTRLGMDTEEVATIVCAIGHHDEVTGGAFSPISAALILADKSDVRRSRVRNKNFKEYDIHDRVNHAVHSSELVMDADERLVTLQLSIDTLLCPVMDYFEIFLSRMLMCSRAAEFLDLKFHLEINGTRLL